MARSGGKGGEHTMPAIFLLLCLFLSEKKTMPPRKRRGEGHWTPNGAKPLKKKKRRSRDGEKEGNCIPLLSFSFDSHFPLKKGHVYFFRTLIGVEDSPGRHPLFAFPFPLKKQMKKRRKGRYLYAPDVIHLLVPLLL